MPSGYTGKIYDGKPVTKEEFIWDCARAFDAFIEMKDLPLDATAPTSFQSRTYYLENKQAREKELEEILALPTDAVQTLIDKEHEEERTSLQHVINEKNELKERYEAMLEEVNAWEPPTPDHMNLKTFSIDQLNGSISHDCNISYYVERLNERTEKPTVEQWLVEHEAQLKKEITYYENEWEKEQERTRSRNEWINALRQSLNTK